MTAKAEILNFLSGIDTTTDEWRKTARHSTSRLTQMLSKHAGVDVNSINALDRQTIVALAVALRNELYDDDDLRNAIVELAIVDDAVDESDELTPWDEALAQAEVSTTTYATVEFPIAFVRSEGLAGVFKFSGSDVEFQMTETGLDYILYRLHGFIERDSAWVAYNGQQWTTLEAIINASRSEQVAAQTRAGKRAKFVAVTQDGLLMSLLTTYKPVKHAEVLRMVKDAGLASNVASSWVSPVAMTLFIESDFEAPESFVGSPSFAMIVRNGETGHRRLEYRAVVRVGEYQFEFPTRDAARHLGSVADVVAHMRDMFDELVAIEADEWLRNALPAPAIDAARKAVGKLSEDKLARFNEELSIRSFSTSMDVLVFLVSLRDERGWKSAATSAADAVFMAAWEAITASDD